MRSAGLERMTGWRPARPPRPGWLAAAGAVLLCLYFLVAHGCHGEDADHELLLAPVKQPALEGGTRPAP